MKKLYIFLLTLILCAPFLKYANAFAAQGVQNLTLVYDGAEHEYAAAPVSLVINGKGADNLTMPPIIFNDYTLVPARDVFELLGARVLWDAETMDVTIIIKKSVITLGINKSSATVNGSPVKMDIPPKFINGKTMIPLRFVADNLNFLVFWEAESRTVFIDDLGLDTVSAPGGETPVKANPVRDISQTSIQFESHPETGITGIVLPQNGNNYFGVTADSAVSRVEKTLLLDNRMYIDIYGAVLNVPPSVVPFADNPDVFSIRWAQNQTEPEKIVRVVFDLKEGAEYSVDLSADRKTVSVSFSRADAANTEQRALPEITVSTGSNISYDFNSRSIVINSAPSLNINEFIHTDNYLSLEYIITIPDDLSGYFEQGKYVVGDSFINSVSVKTEGGRTSIIMDEVKVWAYNIYEEGGKIYIKPVPPKEKYEKIVVIDPGHGGAMPGTSGFGLVERDLNLDIALRLVNLISADNRIKVYSTRLTDVDPAFEERSRFGSETGDLFVSIHNNFVEIRPGVPNETVNGTETFYFVHSNDANNSISSKSAAEIMQKSLVAVIKSYDRGVKTDNYIVLVQSTVPAVLCEIGFLSNPEEAQRLSTPEYRQTAAYGLYEGILNVFNVYTPKR